MFVTGRISARSIPSAPVIVGARMPNHAVVCEPGAIVRPSTLKPFGAFGSRPGTVAVSNFSLFAPRPWPLAASHAFHWSHRRV